MDVILRGLAISACICICGIIGAAFVLMVGKLISGIIRHFHTKEVLKKIFARYHVGKYGDNE